MIQLTLTTRIDDVELFDELLACISKLGLTLHGLVQVLDDPVAMQDIVFIVVRGFDGRVLLDMLLDGLCNNAGRDLPNMS